MKLLGEGIFLLLGISYLFFHVEGRCRHANWWSNFDGNKASDDWIPTRGLAKCDGSLEYIRGFYRNNRQIPDRLGYIEEANCCTAPGPFTNEPTQVTYANWWSSFDWNNHWNLCPDGYFLQGLYRTDKEDRLWSIEEGRCAKPATHPHKHTECYEHDITLSFDKVGWSNCNDGYFVTGLYRGICDELFCLEKMKCCKMATDPIKVDSIDKAKRKVMDVTMSQMAKLASYLGFSFCLGCRGVVVGDDFRKQGDKWVADHSDHCPDPRKKSVCDYLGGQWRIAPFIPIGHCDYRDGNDGGTRLTMDYSDWKFSLSNIKYGPLIQTDIRPEYVDSNVCKNDASFPTPCAGIHRTETAERTVSHTALDSFTHAEHLGISIGYTPPAATGGLSAGMNYDFSYSNTKTATDSSGHKQTNQLSTGYDDFMIPPCKALNYTLWRYKAKFSQNYTATVRIDFSTQFDSIMQRSNFYEGSGHIHYRFGSKWRSFAKDLRQKVEDNERPWRWNDMKALYPQSKKLIQDLTNENRYTFTLHGRFEDIQGTKLVAEHHEIPLQCPEHALVGRNI